MNIQFKLHAEDRLVEYSLDREQVISVVLEPEQVISKGDEPRIAQSRVVFNNKQYLLRVVFRDEGETRWIITVNKTSQVKRYWRKETGDEN